MTEAMPSPIDVPVAANDPPNEAPGSAQQASRSRVRYNAALKLVRRMHLFAGLFMTPWVFLYGITGFLFNHPDAFSDRAVRTVDRSVLVGTDLERFPTAAELGDSIVKALNDRAGSPAFRLVDRDHASYSRTLFVTATGEGREHSVRFDPDSGEAFIRTATVALFGSTSWPGGASIPLDEGPRDRLSRGVPALLAKLGFETSATTVRNPPDLICTIEQGSRRWHVTYNIQTGATSAEPDDEPVSRLSIRRFLTGLHLAFTYPSRLDARWFWAVAVDAMFVSMVFWGASGILMWWQMKKLRGWGAVTLVLSAVAATSLAVGMHEVLASRL